MIAPVTQPKLRMRPVCSARVHDLALEDFKSYLLESRLPSMSNELSNRLWYGFLAMYSVGELEKE